MIFGASLCGTEFARRVDLFAELDHALRRPVDLTRYAGLTFWVRGSVARSAAVSVVLNDGTGSIADGGSFSGLPSLAFTPTGAWQRVSFPFAGLGSITGVVSLDFVILDGGESLDLWIDDVALDCGGVCQL